MGWIADAAPANVAWKANDWSNNTGGVGSGLPPPALAQVGQDFAHRCWTVWLYPPGLVVTYWWDQAIDETGLLRGRKVNPTGPPTVYYHDGDLKLLFVQWAGEGGGAGALYRANLHCHYAP